MKMFPSEIAFVLGIQQRIILKWIERQELPATIVGKYIYIDYDDLIRYLYHHPENVGRIYCDDLPGYVTELRTKMVNDLEGLSYAERQKGYVYH